MWKTFGAEIRIGPMYIILSRGQHHHYRFTNWRTAKSGNHNEAHSQLCAGASLLSGTDKACPTSPWRRENRNMYKVIVYQKFRLIYKKEKNPNRELWLDPSR